MCWSRYTGIPPSTRRRLISAMASRSVPSGSEMARPSGPVCDVGAERGAVEQVARPVGVGALDLDFEGGPGEQLGDRTLADHRAAVDDGHRVAGALDLVEEVGRQHHGAALGHERLDHVAHVEHPPRVEPVHRLVEDQQLRVAEEARGDAQPLAHAHGVLRHLVVGAVQDARHARAPARSRPLAAGSRAAARICRFWRPVRWPWKRGSSTMAPTRARARSRWRGTLWPSRNMVPASACVRPSSTLISVVLPAPLGPR